MKRCSNCFETKPTTEFYPRVQMGRPGHQSRCKACNAEVVAGWKIRNRLGEVKTYKSRAKRETP